MKRQIISLLAVLTLLPLTGAAWAGWEEAVAAYQAGDRKSVV